MATGGSLSYDDWIISKRKDEHLTRKDIRGKLRMKKDQVAILIKGVQNPKLCDLVERHSEVMLVSLQKENCDDIVERRLPENKWMTYKLPELPRCMVEDRVHVVLKEPDIQQSVGQRKFKDILADCELQQNRITTKPPSSQIGLQGRWHHLREGHYRLGNLVRQPNKRNVTKSKENEDAMPSSSFDRNIPRSKSLPPDKKQERGQPQKNFEGEISWQRFKGRSTNIQVGVGDITKLNVDAIVNAANSFLQHSGGVAGAISKAAGTEMDNECRDFIKKKGPLPPGHCVMTAAGKLPCKHIIHTVGPRKSEYKRMEECTAVLKQAYARCLEKATEEKLTTMAMPAVSAGIYGVPKAQVTEALCAVLQEFCNSTSGLKGNLKRIYLVDIDKQVINSIKERLSNSTDFTDIHVSPQSTDNPRDKSHRKSFINRFRDSFRSRKRTRGPPTKHDDTTIDGQEVFGTTTAEIREEVADILLRGDNKGREKIPVIRQNNKSYIEASWVDFAGLLPELQKYSYISNLNINDTDILKYLKRFRLPIAKFKYENKVKYFEWNEPHNTIRLTLCGAEKRNVDNARRDLLSHYQDLCQNVQSQELGQPITEFTDKSEAITSMENQYKCIITKKPNGKIHICGPKNKFAAFQVELSNQIKHSKQNIPGSTALVGQVSISPNLNQPNATPISATNNAPTTLFLSPEEIYIKISVGDITALNLDVIVNAADQYMEHGGGVSKSISKAAGKKLREECEKHITMYGPVAVGTTLVTTGGNLTCKKVIHAVGPRWSDYDKNHKTECLHMLHDTYLRCLHQARPYETIALPAISAGTFEIPKGKVSDTLLKAVDSFCKEYTGKLQTIQIIDIDEAIIKKIRDKFHKAERYTLQHNFVRGGGQPQISRKAKKGPAIPNDQYEELTRLVSRDGENNVSVHANLPNTPKADQADCVICLDTMKHPKQLHLCKHTFCRDCIDRQFKIKPMCPVCGKAYGVIQGNQPRGTMEVSFKGDTIPGYEGSGSIVITYTIPNGIQTDDHPNPGVPYTGTIRRAYLPRNAEGKKVLSLLRKAFDARLIFTVGTSHTQHTDNVVTWNDIHHKTSVTGGSSNFGYPDPGYLKRVQDELAAKGIVSSDAN